MSDNIKSRFGIRSKLIMGFMTVALILGAAMMGTLIVISQADNNATYILKTDLPLFEGFFDLGLQLAEAKGEFSTWMLTSNEHNKQEFERNWRNIQRIQTNIDKKLAENTDTNLLQQWNTIKSLMAKLFILETQLVTHADKTTIQQTLEQAAVVEEQVKIVLDGQIGINDERKGGILDIQYQAISEGSNVILDNLDTIRMIGYALILIIFVVSLVIALFTAGMIINPLTNAINIAKNIASGKRDNEIVITSRDETGELLSALSTMQSSIIEAEQQLKENEAKTRLMFEDIASTAEKFSIHSSKIASGDLRERLSKTDNASMSQLGNDLNLMTDSLSGITKQITESSHYITTTLEEIRQAVSVQTSGASEQASSINEITSSLEEIEKSTAQTLEKANSLGDIAERTREKGHQGLEAVEQSIAGMQTVRDKVQMIAQTILDLSKQTQQVGEITAAVTTLAQQSKMLALNASIEAAKAGESGKGFAVVAAEVKNLAEQSEQSTTQVQKILEDIRQATEKAVMVTEEGTKGVDHGMVLVEQTGDIVRSLSNVINEATMASQQIGAAVRQEGIGIEQITSGMNEINQVTTSFVASAKQTLEAITQLSEISKQLKERVDTYKI